MTSRNCIKCGAAGHNIVFDPDCLDFSCLLCGAHQKVVTPDGATRSVLHRILWRDSSVTRVPRLPHKMQPILSS